MMEILLSFIAIHLNVDGNIYHHGQYNHGHFRYTNNPSHRHHRYNTKQLNHQHIDPYAAKASDYDLLIAQEELRDILRAQHQYIADEELDEMDPDAVWLTQEANQVSAPHSLFVTGKIVYDKKKKIKGRKIIWVKWPMTGGGVDKIRKFRWNEYKGKIDANVLTEEQKQSVYGPHGLRVQTQRELLQYSCEANKLDYNQICYFNMGSSTAKSDLDFSYIRWDKPKKVVASLVTFYNQHYIIMGLWPSEAFDMNFYIATGFVKNTPTNRCWEEIDKKIQPLFHKIWDNGQRGDAHEAWYEFAGKYSGSERIKRSYQQNDLFMAYLLIQRRFEKGMAEGDPEQRTINLIKFSEIYYSTIDLIKHDKSLIDDDNKLNRMKLYLKTYLYLMNYWSEEGFISLQALQYITKKNVEKISENGKLLAAYDCIAFINHDYNEIMEHGEDPNRRFLWFWNEISKYVYRFMDLLNQLPEFEHLSKIVPAKKLKPKKSKKGKWGDLYTGEFDRKIYEELQVLYGFAVRWQRKWNEKSEEGAAAEEEEEKKEEEEKTEEIEEHRGDFKYGGNGQKKIRGDVPFDFLLTTGEPPADDIFLRDAVPEAREIWDQIKDTYKNGERLYKLIDKVKVYIDKKFESFKAPHRKALTKVYLEIEDMALKEVFKQSIKGFSELRKTAVTETVQRIRMGKIDVDGSGKMVKQIIYEPLTEDEVKRIKNPFARKEIQSKVEI